MEKKTWKCPKCGITNSLDDTTCSVCHQAVPDTVHVTAESVKEKGSEKGNGEQTFFTVLGILFLIGGFIAGILVAIFSEAFWLCFSIWVPAFLNASLYLGIGILFGRVEELKRAIENKHE